MHWTDQIYGRGRVGQGPALHPIAYTPGFEKKKLPVATQASNAPIAESQGVDAHTAELLTSDKATPKGYPGEVYNALVNAGLSGPVLAWAFTQLYMESDGFSNTPARKDNNPGNIMWFAGQRKGTYIPSNKTYVIHFTSLAQFADQYWRELNKGAQPLKATSVEDFVHRLKMNGYMGNESEASYLAKMKATAARLQRLDKFYKATRKKMHKDSHPFKMPVWGWIVAGLAGFVILKNAVR